MKTINTDDISSLAEKALAAADVKEMFGLFNRAVKERGEALTALDGIVHHYAGKGDLPRYVDSSPVESMERVALAAIALAEKIATKP